MDAWWGALPTGHQVLYVIAGTVSLILVVQLVMALFGLGGDTDADGDVPDGDLDLDGADLSADVVDGHAGLGHMDADAGGHTAGGVASLDDVDSPPGDHGTHHDAGIKILSIRSIMAFLTGLSWSMLVVLRSGGGYGLASFVGFLVGGGFSAGVIGIMVMMTRMQVSGNIDLRNAAGVEGTVYLPIPPSREGKGQVQLKVQGRIRELDAVTDETSRIPVGTKVVAAHIIDGSVAVVVRMEDI